MPTSVGVGATELELLLDELALDEEELLLVLVLLEVLLDELLEEL